VASPAAAPPRPRRAPCAPSLTDRDRLLLEFIAEHRLILRDHVRALLGVSGATASRRLRGLVQAGLVHRDALFKGYPAHYRIAGAGLAAIASRLPAPKRDLEVRHEIGLAWLWLAAQRGAFGELSEVVSERRMRSRDGREQHAARITGRREHEPFGVRLYGVGPVSQQRLHYPDLLLVDRGGRRIAVELELSSKGRARRHRIIGGYAADRRVDAVLYLVKDERIGRQVRDAARRFGFEPRVLVQPVRLGAGQAPVLGGAGRAPAVRALERGSGR
jgi:DNA-binding transcriptional ArsR family regulator